MTLLLIAGVTLLALAALAGIDVTFSYSVTSGSDNVSASETVTGDEKVYAVLTIPAAGNDDYMITGDPDDVKGYAILSDQNVTLVTTNNPAGTPDTINLVANEPLVWSSKAVWSNGHFLNRSPWVKWNFACAGATPATVTVLIIRDGTP